MPGTRLTIEMTEKGEITVTGPFENKVICYGLLEVARDIVRNHQTQPKSGIVAPTYGPVPVLPKM